MIKPSDSGVPHGQTRNVHLPSIRDKMADAVGECLKMGRRVPKWQLSNEFQ